MKSTRDLLTAFIRRLRKGRRSALCDRPPATPDTADLINVRDLLKRLSVDELNAAAEQYYRRLESWDYHLAKPFANIGETPELLICLAHILMGLKLAPEMTVVDFGAGSCWASRCLTQLGIQVISVDASSTALKIGEALYARQPVAGDRPKPRFLPFNGRVIDLPDASVDRIICLDAFHHVPNPDAILQEMGRILAPGGIAGFSEPGPTHSKQAQSQYEMRHHTVLENDIVLRDIREWAERAGFVDLRVALFNGNSVVVSLAELEGYLSGGPSADEVLLKSEKSQLDFLEFRRLFFLKKAGEQRLDSRQIEGLSGKLDILMPGREGRPGERLRVTGSVTNDGGADWLPASAKIGGVKVGVHLLNGEGGGINHDFFRQHLTPDPGRKIPPGEALSLDFAIPLPATPGRYQLEFDLVSEGVSWFANRGLRTIRIPLIVQ